MDTKKEDEERLHGNGPAAGMGGRPLLKEPEAARPTRSDPADIVASAKRDAEDLMKFAQDSGDKALIEAAKAQAASASGMDPAADEAALMQAIAKCERVMDEMRPKIEGALPPYSAPSAADRV